MRLRNIPGSREVIAANEFVIHEPEQNKGYWHTIFNNNNPIHIEIGMGKGAFLNSLAAQNRNINYIGIEKYSSVLLRALEKTEQNKNSLNQKIQGNLIFIRFDAEYICNIFDKEEISRIYLNFSDPWPKDRHAKRRLTSKEFLFRYNQFLKRDGFIAFKTDNRELFDFSLNQAQEAGWQLRDITYDLHGSTYHKDNIMTEYEEKFSSLGNPIYRMVTFPS